MSYKCECCENESNNDLCEECAKNIGDFFRTITDAFFALSNEEREYVVDNNDFNEILKGLI